MKTLAADKPWTTFWTIFPVAMAISSPGQPPIGIDLFSKDGEPSSKLSLEGLRPSKDVAKPTLWNQSIAYLHGKSRIVWEEEEVDHMIIKENMESAVKEKFSYGWPKI